jgi:hypothetical protein
MKAVAILLVAGTMVASAWSLMIIVGVAHGSWWHLIPTMSYGTALGLVFIASLVPTVIALLKETLLKGG